MDEEEKVDKELIYKVLGNGQNEAPKLAEIKKDENPTFGVEAADTIAAFAGSITFLLLNLGWFLLWIIINTLTPYHFDAFPFQFLTMAVSLEAIFLSIFVLISQNRQAAKDRLMVEHDYETNRRGEKETRIIIEKVDRIEAMLSRTNEHSIHFKGHKDV